MRRIATVLVSALLLSACAAPPAPPPAPFAVGCAQAAAAQPRRAAVEQGFLPTVVFADETRPASIAARMAEHRVPALSVAVIDAGALDWAAVYGRLSADGPAARCDTLFQAGSLAKPATVLAALRLERAGLIELDRDIATLLRSVQLPAGRQSASDPVTLRHLLTHTSGLTPGGYAGYAQGRAIPTLPEIVAGAPGTNSRKVEVLRKPGEQLQYSGGGYTVAQIALQDSQAQDFEPLMRRWLFEPVGMGRSTFALQRPDAPVALGHLEGGRPVVGGWHHHPESAAAGLWSNASELAALLIEVWKGYHGRSAVFDPASIRAELLGAPNAGHAYGFRLVGEGAERFIVHYGGTTGYNAGMAINLTTGQGAVYLANAEAGRQLGHEFLMAVSRAYGWGQFRPTRVSRATVEAAALDGLAGRYRFAGAGASVGVERSEDLLTLVFPNGDRYALTPIVDAEPLQFIHASTGVRAGFERGADGVPQLQLYGDRARRESD